MRTTFVNAIHDPAARQKPGPKGVSEADVFAAANTLLSQSLKPTVAAVHALLGNRDSSTTITQHMKAWRDKYLLQAKADLPQTLIQEMEALKQTSFADGKAKAEEIFGLERVDVLHFAAAVDRERERREELEKQLRDIQTAHSALQAMLAERTGDGIRLRGELARAESATKIAEAEAARLRAESAERAAREAALQAKLQELQLRLAREAQHSAELRAELAATQSSHDKLEAQLRERPPQGTDPRNRTGDDGGSASHDIVHATAWTAVKRLPEQVASQRRR